MNEDVVELTRGLIRCQSVTPDEGGALAYLETRLAAAGFTCHRLKFSDRNSPDVENLYARIGSAAPHLCFAGHTDVVPPGDLAAWSSPPFAAEIRDGVLIGRGAADMKGGVGSFVVAALDYLRDHPEFARSAGSISFLITGDEEGQAINGTVKVLDWLREQGEQIDHCIVGEPSNPDYIGQSIKVGRRGSLNGWLTVTGQQGHVAYQHLANNPVPGLLAALTALDELKLDEGTRYFEPSNLEITSIDIGNPSTNVIPRQARAQFNIRFNDAHSGASLQELITGVVKAALEGFGLEYDLAFTLSGESFVTEDPVLIEKMAAVIEQVTGHTPEKSTSGGTSDARFIKNICPVIEFGLVNRTIHKVDEQVPVDDLHVLKQIYQRFIERYFTAV